MEEELNDEEIEAQLYSMLHHGDGAQRNDESSNSLNNEQCNNHVSIATSTPRSNGVRRYWHSIGDKPPLRSPFHKTNPTPVEQKTTNKKLDSTDVKSKDGKALELTPKEPTVKPVSKTPSLNNAKFYIQIMEHDEEKNNAVVELVESSDEDEVVEVALPPKPTITIESSDEEDLQVVLPQNSSPTNNDQPKMDKTPNSKKESNKQSDGDREVSSSPVPSVVSSVSDDFIRSDCIALNISSRSTNQPSFDFTLHGNDLLDQSTPAKKKKKKKNKDKTPVTDITVTSDKTNNLEECFATPKSKSKNKRQKNRLLLTENANHDMYDSDHNRSIDSSKSKKQYKVSEIPNADVYESDSNQSAIVEATKDNETSASSGNVSPTDENILAVPGDKSPEIEPSMRADQEKTNEVVDLTEDSVSKTIKQDMLIEDNIVMANVTGFPEPDEISDRETGSNNNAVQNSSLVLGSTKVPTILYENLDFDNLKGNTLLKTGRFSLTTLRADMDKFYNESWGGENFNHREIQKAMSRDKSLWAIDPKDRMPTPSKKKLCHYCNRPGHRDTTCLLKTPVCHMCGDTGHYEPRCPRKICVNCGSPNYMYSSMCRNCAGWGRIRCPECGQIGHPFSHCPDTWRRYHNTIDDTMVPVENRQLKRTNQMFCSGCTRRGHLIHTCRISIPFSGLPINSPYVTIYRPIYPISRNRNDSNRISESINADVAKSPSSPSIQKSAINKRQSKSPNVHATHVNKRRNTSMNDDLRNCTPESQIPEKVNVLQQSFDLEKTTGGTKEIEPALDYIPIVSTNHDEHGQLIQDNQVSDTSDAVTSARIYVTKDIIEKLGLPENKEWLKMTTEKHNVTVAFLDLINYFISIKGKVGDQEAFQTELKSYNEQLCIENSKDNETFNISGNESSCNDVNNIPRNRNNALRILNKAFASLKQKLGDPNKMFKELTYLQNHHIQLVNQKNVSPKQVSNNRNHINQMLKKLNMVLVGQAGLAGGTQHMRELLSIQTRLTNYRQKNITNELRQEIGQHYHIIFTANPRNDYRELLKMYYTNTENAKTPIFNKKKYENTFKFNTKHQMKMFDPRRLFDANDKHSVFKNNGMSNLNTPTPLLEKALNKLTFYRRRLSQTKANNAEIMKVKHLLEKRLHTEISVLGTVAKITPKKWKKLKKVQEQAQRFLASV